MRAYLQQERCFERFQNKSSDHCLRKRWTSPNRDLSWTLPSRYVTYEGTVQSCVDPFPVLRAGKVLLLFSSESRASTSVEKSLQKRYSCRTLCVPVNAESTPGRDRTVDKRTNGLSNLLEFPAFNLSNFFSTAVDEKKDGVQLTVSRTFDRKVRESCAIQSLIPILEDRTFDLTGGLT